MDYLWCYLVVASRLLGALRAYSPNRREWEFSEVRIAPVQYLWASMAEIGCLRVLSRLLPLPHNTRRSPTPSTNALGIGPGPSELPIYGVLGSSLRIHRGFTAALYHPPHS